MDPIISIEFEAIDFIFLTNFYTPGSLIFSKEIF